MHTVVISAAIITATAALFAISCGPQPHEQAARHEARAVAVQGWDVGPDLASRKQLIVNILRSEGASDEKIALTIACVMGETVHISCGERDASKDSMGDAKNWSAYNMNSFALKKLGWVESASVDLNHDDHLAAATKFFSQGLDKFGIEKWLCLHRGGETAFCDGVSYGARDYISAITSIRDHLLADKLRLVDGKRYGADIPHV